jgi:hypothetical protein
VSGTVTRTLIHSHKSHVLRDPADQTADGDFIVRSPGLESSTILRIRVASPRAQPVVQNSLHLVSLCFLVTQQQRWVWLPPAPHHQHCRDQSCSRESPTVVGGFVSCLLEYCKYMLQRKYGIRHDHIAWYRNKIMFVCRASVYSVGPRSSWFLLHRETVAYDYKKSSLDGLQVHDRIFFFFFSQTKSRNLVKIWSAVSLYRIIRSLERSFTAS